MSDENVTGDDAQAAAAPDRPRRPDYRVAVLLPGAPLPEEGLTVNSVNVPVVSVEPDDVAAALLSSGLSAADVRSRTVLVAPPGDGEQVSAVVAAAMAALWGLSRHRVDVLLPDTGVVLDCAEADEAYRAAGDGGRPEARPDLVTASMGEGPLIGGFAHVTLGPGLSAQQVGLLRFAKRVLWVPSGNVGADAVSLLALAGIRARGDHDRLPAMWLDSHVPPDDGGMPGRVVDLGAVRRAAEGVRAATRTDDRGGLADPVALTDRQVFLESVARTPVEDVLAGLGVASAVLVDEESGEAQVVWHCPHPEKHTNGDATPSARVEDDEDGRGFRCMRCLPERVDALRLVMWARREPVDDAARWLAELA